MLLLAFFFYTNRSTEQRRNGIDGREKRTNNDDDDCVDGMVAGSKAWLFVSVSSWNDENAWAGTEFARMGDGHKTFAVLTATFDGMPLIYTGQESAMDKKLEFFEKDEVPWGSYEYTNFYKTLFDLKHRNKALWNGQYGGELVKIPTGNDENVYAFYREKEDDKVIVILNLSNDNQEIKLEGSDFIGDYNDIFAQGTTTLTEDMMMNLKPWDYIVLSNN